MCAVFDVASSRVDMEDLHSIVLMINVCEQSPSYSGEQNYYTSTWIYDLMRYCDQFLTFMYRYGQKGGP